MGALAVALGFSLHCNQLMDLLDKDNKVSDTAPVAPANGLDTPGSWTILVYLDAANNLEGAGVQDVAEMKAMAANLGSNKIYVLMDRMTGFSSTGMAGINGGADFTGAVLFEVSSAGGGTLVHAGLNPWSGFGNAVAGTDEVNSGAEDTLTKFLTWGYNKAKTDGSNHIYVDIWDHGAGWGGTAYAGGAVAWDDEVTVPGTTRHDSLSIDEIINSMKAAETATARKATILGFDACYMGTIENAYSFKNYASIMVASEELEPGAGWQYTNWVPRGSVSPRAVASNVVTTFKASYSSSGEQVTLSAIDLAKLDGISSALETFLSKMGTQQPASIATARQQSQSYNNDLSIDIYDFVDKVKIPEADSLKNMIKASIVAEAHTEGGKVAGSNGMTVYFPQSKSNYDSTYNATSFASTTRWDDFVSGKLVSFEISSTEPADTTCGGESNNSAATANKITTATMASCTGYVYTASDVDIYRIGVGNMTNALGRTLTVNLSNIPAGADFDVLLFNTDVSPSAPIAAGVRTSNTSESFTIDLFDGSVVYPGLGTCTPTDPNNSLTKQSLCYGSGVFDGSGASSNDFYLVVVGKSNSYSQVGKYTLSISATNATLNQVP